MMSSIITRSCSNFGLKSIIARGSEAGRKELVAKRKPSKAGTHISSLVGSPKTVQPSAISGVKRGKWIHFLRHQLGKALECRSLGVGLSKRRRYGWGLPVSPSGKTDLPRLHKWARHFLDIQRKDETVQGSEKVHV